MRGQPEGAERGRSGDPVGLSLPDHGVPVVQQACLDHQRAARRTLLRRIRPRRLGPDAAMRQRSVKPLRDLTRALQRHAQQRRTRSAPARAASRL